MQKYGVGRLQSYIQNMEDEVIKWKRFKESLSKEDSEAFSQLVEACRKYVISGSKADRRSPLEAMIMSMLLQHERNLENMRKTLVDLTSEFAEDQEESPINYAKIENKRSEDSKREFAISHEDQEMAFIKLRLKNYLHYLDFEESEESKILVPKVFLGKENFSKIIQIIKSLGGSYISDGRNSHFKIPNNLSNTRSHG